MSPHAFVSLKQGDFPGEFPSASLGLSTSNFNERTCPSDLMDFKGWKLATKWRGCVHPKGWLKLKMVINVWVD